jgi:hypothetical protein
MSYNASYAAGRDDTADDEAVVAGNVASTAVWDAVRQNCALLEAGNGLQGVPLWHRAPNPLQREWDDTRTRWSTPNSPYTFWRRWYEAALEGRSLNLELERDIALIPDEDWKKGAAHIAAIIAKLELVYAIAATPNSEDILRDDSGLFYALPVTTIRPDLFENAKAKVADTIVEIRRKPVGNTYMALQDDLARLDDYLDRYGNNPQRIHDVFQKTIRHINEKSKSGELAPDELISDLRQDLDTGATDIRRSDSEVSKTVKARTADRVARLKKEDKAQFDAVMYAASEESRADLKAEIVEDIATTNDPKTEAEDKDEGRYRLFSRVVRMAKARKDDVVKVADDAGKLSRGADAAGKASEAAGGWWQTISDMVANVFG